MKTLSYIIFLGIFTAFSSALQAQQVHQLTQFSTNTFVYNPAIAGNSLNDLMASASYRKQWSGGFEGEEPTTMLLSVHSNLSADRSVGLGGMLFHDKTGPTSRMGVQLAYAYHLPLDRYGEQFLSFGVSGTIMQYSLNFSDLDLRDAGDLAAMEASASQMAADANFGAFLYGENYFVGASALQLAQTALNLSERSIETQEETLSLSRHFYFMGGYRYDFDKDGKDAGFSLMPYGVLKYVKAVPIQFEIAARLLYKDKYWGGIGMRTGDAIAVHLGLEIDDGLSLQYSYDYITSEIGTVSNGSHEITLAYRMSVWNR
ncbi:type IX secretion system membrane protein PorP/SprF [Chitinophagales bacterium]|nr:type IX secretion system membrane protein PorP/SprF [Chitinophagales bacterium]